MARSPTCSLAFVLSLALFLPAPGAASVALRASVEDLARSSDAVVRGKVERQRSSWMGRRIYTEVEVRASSVWRGSAPGLVKVLVPGGVVGDIGQHVDAAPRFVDGEEVVVFVSSSSGRAMVNGLAQGKFTVQGATVLPGSGGTTLLRGAVRPGDRPSEEMPLAELERRVKEAR
jgi:hypothetical protein